MALPKQLQDQLADVKELQKELSGSAEEGVDVVTDDDTQAAAEANTPDPDPDPVPAVDVSEHDDAADEDFQHKYNTLQGMYNADMARLQAEARSNNDRVAQLEQLLSNMSEAPKEEAKPAPVETPPSLLSKADVDDFGDSIDIMRKVAKEEMHSITRDIASLKGAIDQLKANIDTQVVPQIQRVTETTNASTVDRFWSSLGERIPDWQALNNDADFHAWLYQTDVLTGKSRQALLEEAQKALNIERVVAFFDTYKSLQSETKAKTDAQSDRSASELEKQVAPGRSRAAANPVNPNAAKTYTPADIEKFYHDISSGKYKGRDTERSRIERDIFAAQQDGRIMQPT